MKEVVDLLEENRDREMEMNQIYNDMDRTNNSDDDELDEELRKMEQNLLTEQDLEPQPRKNTQTLLKQGPLSDIKEVTDEKNSQIRGRSDTLDLGSKLQAKPI